MIELIDKEGNVYQVTFSRHFVYGYEVICYNVAGGYSVIYSKDAFAEKAKGWTVK